MSKNLVNQLTSNPKVVFLLGSSGLVCLVFGILALMIPSKIAARIGYEFASSGGKGEFMTFYGGFYAGIGIFLLTSIILTQLRPGAASFLAISATGAILVRVYTILFFDVSESIFYQLLMGEILFATVGWLSWHMIHRPDDI